MLTMKKLIGGGLLALTIGVLLAPVAEADPITPDEWGMDDGIGVGTRTAGTSCLRWPSVFTIPQRSWRW